VPCDRECSAGLDWKLLRLHIVDFAVRVHIPQHCAPSRSLVETPSSDALRRVRRFQNDREAVLLVERTGYDMARLQAAHGLPGWEVRTFVRGTDPSLVHDSWQIKG
jgi:hypothetical protein